MIDYLKYAFNNIMKRKTRSFLTILSIVIGISAIFALVSFGSGVSNYVDVMSSQAGADKIMLQSRGSGISGTNETFTITRDDLDFIEKINGVAETAGIYMNAVIIEFNDEQAYAYGMSIHPEEKDLILEVFGVDVEKGRFFEKGEKTKVVLGYNYQVSNKVFSKPINLRDEVELNGQKFQVIGFFEQVGNPEDDSAIYLTPEGLEIIAPKTKNKYTYAIIRTIKGEIPEKIAERITQKLRKEKNQKEGEETFFVQTFEQLIEVFNTVLSAINGVLILIALISLIVAAINIMNTMYTAVLERTKEIGVMKSIGAKNSSIKLIFLIESGFLGLIGGILGVLLGWGIASFGGYIAVLTGYSILQPLFPLILIVGCIVFAVSVGLFAGYFPANQASKLKPVDALRYE